MNIIELQDNLKELPDSALMREMQMPSGNAPQFLVLSELKRRKRMRDEYQRREAADIPTVAEETITAAGMPQQGIMQAARAMAPKSSIAQNTGMDMAMPMQPTQAPQQPQMMADGGVVKMQTGGAISAQPTGDGGTYILMQDGERVPGTGIYPDFRSANEAARALRGSQPFQTARILEEPDPILETEVSELSQVSADPMAFAANDEIRRQLQLRQARGQRDDAEVGGIASLDPFGRAFMDEYRPDMSVASSREGIPEFGDAAYAQTNVADLLETMSKANEGIVRDELPASADDDLRFSRGTASSIAPSAGSEAINAMRAGADLSQMSGGIGRVSADLSNVESAPQIDFDAVDPSIGTEEPDSGFLEFLSSLRTPDDENPMVGLAESGIESASNIIDPEFTGREEAPFIRPSKLSGDNFSNDPNVGYSYPTDVPPLDPSMEASEVLKRLAENQGGGLPENIYGGYEDPEAIARRQEIERMISLEPLGEGMQDDVKTVVDEAAKKAAQKAMTTGTELVIPSEEEGGIESLLPPSLTGGDAGGDTGGTSTGSADFGSIESRIARMLADREKSAEADKWMSLAQAGMALMASKNPTFGGALGEAGLAGIGAMQKARSQYDKDILGLLGMQQQIESAKDLASYRQGSLDAKGDKTGLRPSDLIDYLGTLQREQTDLTKQLSENLTGDPKLTQQRLAINEVEIERIKRMLGYGGSSTTDLAD